MVKTLEIEGKIIEYHIRTNGRARRMKISISSYGEVSVTVPRFVPHILGLSFLKKNASWVHDRLAHVLSSPRPVSRETSRALYEKHKEDARKLAHARVAHYGAFYNFTWNKVAIRNQKTRWGSCSKKGNLNFSYKIAFLPPHLADYIIVHELCHLAEFNHGEKFWNLVAQSVPNHKALRKELSVIGL